MIVNIQRMARAFYVYESDGRLCVQHTMFEEDVQPILEHYGKEARVPLGGDLDCVVRVMPSRDAPRSTYVVVGIAIERRERHSDAR
jgi:hypothetical protein